MVHIGLKEAALTAGRTEFSNPCTEHRFRIKLLALTLRDANLFYLLNVVTRPVKDIHHVKELLSECCMEILSPYGLNCLHKHFTIFIIKSQYFT